MVLETKISPGFGAICKTEYILKQQPVTTDFESITSGVW